MAVSYKVEVWGLGGTFISPDTDGLPSGEGAALPYELVPVASYGSTVTFTAGDPLPPTVTRKPKVFSQWLFYLHGYGSDESAINRNLIYTPITGGLDVHTTPTFDRVMTLDVFGQINETYYKCNAYCLFKDIPFVGAAFNFNKALGGTVGMVTVSTLGSAGYTPFTRASTGTTSALTAICAAFKADDFSILSNQSTNFYPANVGTGNSVTFLYTPASGYVVTGWSFAAARPSTPDIVTSATSQTVLGENVAGVHVFTAAVGNKYSLSVRAGTAADTLPAGFFLMDTVRCVCEGVEYLHPYPVIWPRSSSSAFTVGLAFDENTQTSQNYRTPGRLPGLLVNAGSGFSEYTSTRPASCAVAYGTPPIYIPAYKAVASDLAIDVTLGGAAATAAKVLTAFHGSVSLAAVDDPLPLSDLACWAGANARGIPVVLELDLTLAEGIEADDVVLSATGIGNCTAAWAVSPVYGKHVATVTLDLASVSAGTAAITVTASQAINASALVPQVCLESSTVPGTMTDTVAGVYPMAQSVVYGAVDIRTPFVTGDAVGVLTVGLVRKTGYTPNRIEVVGSGTVRANAPVLPGVDEYQIACALQAEDDGEDIIVRLVVRADECAAPVVTAKAPLLDAGLFTATLTNLTDGVSGKWHSGDLAKLTISVVEQSGSPMTGVAVFGVDYNGEAMVVDGDPVEVTTPLDVSGAHKFEIAMAGTATLSTILADDSAFTPTTYPPTLAITGDSVLRDGTTYYRLGAALAVTIPATSDGKTAISVRHVGTLIATGFPDVTLAEYAATAQITLSLKSKDEIVVVYAVGTINPWACLGVYDYSTLAYVTANRPVCDISAVAPAVLGENKAFAADKPTTLSPPADGYWDAVAVVRQVTTTALLPQVRPSVVAGTTPYLLEAYIGALWVPVVAGGNGLVLADTMFFRWARGYRADQLTTVSISQAEDADGNPLAAAPNVSASAADLWDYTGKPPFSLDATPGASVSLLAGDLAGYVFSRWLFADGTIAGYSQALTVTAALTDIELTPVYRVESADTEDLVMVLNGAAEETEVGLWISKEFRSKDPWAPIVAAVVRSDTAGGTCRLIVRAGRAEHTIANDADIGDERNVSLTIANDAMRRVPLPPVGLSRFHRVGVAVTGGEVVSIAAATGALTLKGGH